MAKEDPQTPEAKKASETYHFSNFKAKKSEIKMDPIIAVRPWQRNMYQITNCFFPLVARSSRSHLHSGWMTKRDAAAAVATHFFACVPWQRGWRMTRLVARLAAKRATCHDSTTTQQLGRAWPLEIVFSNNFLPFYTVNVGLKMEEPKGSCY